MWEAILKKLLNKFLKIPWLVPLVVAIITGFFFFEMKSNSRMETDLNKYMPQKHPAFMYSNRAEKWFDIKDAIIIAIENDKGIYNYDTLKKIKDLTKKLQKMKGIQKSDVTSLYTADNIVGTEGGLDVKAFYKKVPKSAEKLKDLQLKVRNNEMIFGRLVSNDEKSTLIVARINDNVFTQEFYKKILSLVENYEGPEKLYVAGQPIVEGTLAYLMPNDMKRMVPAVIIVIVLVLFLLLRSIKSTITTLLIVIISTIWTFGLMSILNIPIYSVSTMIPVMLIAIGVAYGIHLYNNLHLYMKEHPLASKRDAASDMIHSMWKPVLMAAITTAVGFISLLTSQVYPIKYFGLFTAFGVMIAMFLSLTIIPAEVVIFGLPGFRKKKKIPLDDFNKRKSASFSYKFAAGIIEHKKVIILVTVIIIAMSVYGITKVWINSSFLDKFQKDSPIVQTDRFINQHFGGTSTLNVILEGQKEGTFKDPKVLKLVDKMQRDVESLKRCGGSFSLADYLKRMNKVMHADKKQYDTIPNSRDLIAQYLLLYEMSGDPDKLWQVVTDDYKKANITLQLKSDNSKTLKSAIAIVEKYKPLFKGLDVSVNYAGSGYKALVFTDLIFKGQISSLALSLVIVIGLLTIMFKKLSLGLIGSIPIAITAIINFGIMGLLNIPLSTTTALISSIAIGIGIDYAIHFIERYHIYAIETKNKELTSKLTMYHSGRAIFFNAIVVISGFLVLLLSAFPPNRSLGLLISLNMLTSFIGTVTIVLILLYVRNIYFKNSVK